MSLKIGRFGIPISQRSPSTLKDDGETVEWGGWILGTVANANALARQLVGYVENPDEPIVPVVWSDSSGYTGFYRVLSAEVTAEGERSLGQQQFRVSLERVPSCALPMTELRVFAGVRSNSYTFSSTSSAPYVSVPISTTNWDYLFSGIHRYRVNTSTGDVLAYGNAVPGTGPTTFNNARVGMNIAPADWYTGACEVQFDGVTQAGRWATTTSNWMISNGLVRIRPTTVAASNGVFEVGCWDSTTGWRAVTFSVYASNDPVANHADSCTITRNSPEAATVRITANADPTTVGTMSGATRDRYTLDFTIRRGAPYIEGVINGDGGEQWGFGRNTAESGTLLSGGIIATSSATGTRWVLGMPYAFHRTTNSGWIVSSTTRSTVPFMVSVFGNDPAVHPANQWGDSGAFAGYASRFLDYMGALTEHQHIVTR